jgi:hypothetical protein
MRTMGATVLEGIRVAIRAGWKAWCRARPIPVKFVTGVSNPSMARMDSGEGDPESALPQDVDQLCLYRDQYGGFYTDTQIRLGLKLPQGPCVYAQACNDEVADTLVDEMEAMLMDGIDLSPAEKALLALLKQQLRERDVK